jgi:hypothetical protein
MSLLKMTNANFVCYTSQNDYDELLYFFHDKNKIDDAQLKIKNYGINNDGQTAGGTNQQQVQEIK